MKKILTSSIVILGFVASTSAQSATASATAIIVSPITIELTGTNLHFGSVAKGTTGGTVVLAPNGTRTATGDITLSLNTSPVASAAQFTVTGSAGYSYAITVPTTLTLTHTVTPLSTMVLSNFTSSTGAIVAGAGTGLLGGTGTQVLNVGATLTVAAVQAAGEYTNGSFPVTVNYN